MTLNDINAKFNDETYPLFPFISKTRITLLPKGLYRKHNAKFRGITAVYNNDMKVYEYPLFGMYYIEENLVIVPPEVEINSGKSSFLESTIKSGYKQVDRAPKFKTIFYPEDSEEAKLALANKLEFQATQQPK